jgi:molybdopterin adenylyltransferase
MERDSTEPQRTPEALVGIVTVSDRASRGDYEDRGGPAIGDYLERVLTSDWAAVGEIVADEQTAIERSIRSLAAQGCCLILATGGTGPAPRDVTPEATEAVCSKLLPGFGEAMRTGSLRAVPTAILSRQTAGICDGALVVNLPGQPKAIAECLDAVFAAIPYCIDLVGGPYLETDPAHIRTFRPASATSPRPSFEEDQGPSAPSTWSPTTSV